MSKAGCNFGVGYQYLEPHGLERNWVTGDHSTMFASNKASFRKHKDLVSENPKENRTNAIWL